MITSDVRTAGIHAAYDALLPHTRQGHLAAEIAVQTADALTSAIEAVTAYVDNEEINLGRAEIFAAILAAADAMVASTDD